MVPVELSDAKAELLREVLVSYLSDLRMEIAYSQQRELRDFLKKRGISWKSSCTRWNGSWPRKAGIWSTPTGFARWTCFWA